MQTLSTLQYLHRKLVNPLTTHNHPSPTYNQEARDVEVKKPQHNSIEVMLTDANQYPGHWLRISEKKIITKKETFLIFNGLIAQFSMQ